MLCRQCRRRNEEGSRFCELCGAKMTALRQKKDIEDASLFIEYQGEGHKNSYHKRKKKNPLVIVLGVLLLVAIVMIFTLQALDTQAPSFDHDRWESMDIDDVVAEVGEVHQEEQVGLTIDEARRISEQDRIDLWIKGTNGLFYPAQVVRVIATDWGGMALSPDISPQYPVLNLRDGEQLVTFLTRNSQFSFFEIIEIGYATEERVGITIGHGLSISGMSGVEVINGLELGYEHPDEDIEAFVRRLRTVGVELISRNGRRNHYSRGTPLHFTGDFGEVILVGHFQGTQFVESSLVIDRMFYTWDEFPQHYDPRSSVESTREGYFVVNMDNITCSGLYRVIGSHLQSHIIEIRK